MSIVIDVIDLGKRYELTHQENKKHSFIKSFSNLFNIGSSSSKENFWALKHVSFQIKSGERLGIIGRNGAGKSTLLKILSRIIQPTTGKVSIVGKVSSLLEVGTGFHPELTGRENLYLNGAILGLTRQEINKRFADIVEFSGVERFLDTPVKRYSSGMYVRLAFAVAAHLNADVLLIDEVLAVGDIQFQQKCFEKINDINKSGKTIIFVSHQIGLIGKLCNRAILLRDGQCVSDGNVSDVINTYMQQVSNKDQIKYVAQDTDSFKDIGISSIQLSNISGEVINFFRHDEQITLGVSYRVENLILGSFLGFSVKDQRGRVIFVDERPILGSSQVNGVKIQLPSNFLLAGEYFLTVAIYVPQVSVIDLKEDILSFTIIDSTSNLAAYKDGDCGCVYVKCVWENL